MDHTSLRLTASRRAGEVRRISDVASRTFLSVLFYIFYRSLSSHARSRDFPLASLVLSSLLYFRFFLCSSSSSLSLFLCIPFILSLRIFFLRPSSHLSSRVLLRCSLAPSTPRYVTPSFSLFSFFLVLSSACLPSSSRTGRSCRARG